MPVKSACFLLEILTDRSTQLFPSVVIESEKARMDQSRRRGGEAVRPIDVPGPLGEFERYVGDIIRSERQRVRDRELNEGKLVRPKDASITSGLGEVERKAVEDWETIQIEEKQRLLSLKRFMSERRPMERDRDSPLGITEAFLWLCERAQIGGEGIRQGL